MARAKKDVYGVQELVKMFVHLVKEEGLKNVLVATDKGKNAVIIVMGMVMITMAIDVCGVTGMDIRIVSAVVEEVVMNVSPAAGRDTKIV